MLISYTYNGFGEPSIHVQIEGMTLNDLVVASKLKDHNIYIYKGFIYDQDTKMYYLNSRYYHPNIGRFITPDDPSYLSVENINGLNLYTYCGNNPLINFSNTKYNTGYVGGYSSITNSTISNGSSFDSTVAGQFNSINNILVKGSFRNGLWFGSESITGRYAEGNARAQLSLKNGKFVIGTFGKFSLLNMGGQIGFGQNDKNVSLKGVMDLGTVTGMADLLIDPSKK